MIQEADALNAGGRIPQAAAKYAEADFNKATVEMEEAKYRWQVLQATLNLLAPIMEGKPEMTVAEAVGLAGGSVSEG